MTKRIVLLSIASGALIDHLIFYAPLSELQREITNTFSAGARADDKAIVKKVALSGDSVVASVRDGKLVTEKTRPLHTADDFNTNQAVSTLSFSEVHLGPHLSASTTTDYDMYVAQHIGRAIDRPRTPPNSFEPKHIGPLTPAPDSKQESLAPLKIGDPLNLPWEPISPDPEK